MRRHDRAARRIRLGVASDVPGSQADGDQHGGAADDTEAPRRFAQAGRRPQSLVDPGRLGQEAAHDGVRLQAERAGVGAQITDGEGPRGQGVEVERFEAGDVAGAHLRRLGDVLDLQIQALARLAQSGAERQIVFENDADRAQPREVVRRLSRGFDLRRDVAGVERHKML